MNQWEISKYYLLQHAKFISIYDFHHFFTHNKNGIATWATNFKVWWWKYKFPWSKNRHAIYIFFLSQLFWMKLDMSWETTISLNFIKLIKKEQTKSLILKATMGTFIFYPDFMLCLTAVVHLTSFEKNKFKFNLPMFH